jgi:hypothetical protein
MLSFMGALYRGGAPSNKPLERPGANASRRTAAASAGRSAPSRWASPDPRSSEGPCRLA